MSNDFFNNYEDRLLSDGSINEREEEIKSETVNNGEAEEYYELPLALRSRSLIWSVISFVAGVLSLALCPFYYVSLVFAVGSILSSLISRRNLGFFEKYAVTGLVFGIMGVVCGVFSAIATSLGIFG